jgi:hypothetical protein
MIGNTKTIIARRAWPVNQIHSRFGRGTPAFTIITDFAGTDHVIPAMVPSAPPGDNVVQREFPCLAATILASVAVTIKHLQLGQLSLLMRTFNHIDQADYRGYAENLRNRMDLSPAILKHLGLTSKNQDHGPADAA